MTKNSVNHSHRRGDRIVSRDVGYCLALFELSGLRANTLAYLETVGSQFLSLR